MKRFKRTLAAITLCASLAIGSIANPSIGLAADTDQPAPTTAVDPAVAEQIQLILQTAVAGLLQQPGLQTKTTITLPELGSFLGIDSLVIEADADRTNHIVRLNAPEFTLDKDALMAFLANALSGKEMDMTAILGLIRAIKIGDNIDTYFDNKAGLRYTTNNGRKEVLPVTNDQLSKIITFLDGDTEKILASFNKLIPTIMSLFEKEIVNQTMTVTLDEGKLDITGKFTAADIKRIATDLATTIQQINAADPSFLENLPFDLNSLLTQLASLPLNGLGFDLEIELNEQYLPVSEKFAATLDLALGDTSFPITINADSTDAYDPTPIAIPNDYKNADLGAGYKFKSGKLSYVSAVASGKTKLTATGATSKKLTELTVPATVKVAAVKKTYAVTSVKAAAFKGMKKMKKATLGKNVTAVGKGAFTDTPKLKTLVVKNKALKKKLNKKKNRKAAGIGTKVIIK